MGLGGFAPAFGGPAPAFGFGQGVAFGLPANNAPQFGFGRGAAVLGAPAQFVNNPTQTAPIFGRAHPLSTQNVAAPELSSSSSSKSAVAIFLHCD